MIDLVVTGGPVLTMDPARPVASALAVDAGRIVALDHDAVGLDARRTVDLRGRALLPGFVDAHVHLAWTGLAERAVDLLGATTVDAVLARLDTAARATPTDGWVDAVGYDQRPLGRHLTRHDLDRVSHGRRLLLVHTSGHGQLANTAVTSTVRPPAGGWPAGVVVDDAGEPTGLFLEDAAALVAAARPAWSDADLAAAVAAGAARCASEGVTTVAEAGVGPGLTSRSPHEARAWELALAAGRLPVRARLMPTWGTLAAAGTDPAAVAAHLGLTSGADPDRLALGPVKAWLDGGMMARTAALTAPYRTVGGIVPPADAPGGSLAAELPAITATAVAAHTAGWSLALHAIGDAAVDAALGIVAAAQRAAPRPAARHRVEHAGLVRPDQLPRLAAAGLTAVVQPTFLSAFGDDYAAAMGPTRADWLYRGAGFLAAGVPLAGSSDRPVADGAPLRALAFLLDRRTSSGAVVGPAEALTVEQALAAYTTGAARACGLEHRTGSLTVGRAADLVVLGADPRALPAADLPDLEVTTTVLAGEVTHGAWPG